MPPNRIDIKEVEAALSEWSAAIKKDGLISEAYLFGSSINSSGRHFIVSGATRSDIDILLKFANPEMSALERWSACRKIQDTIGDVEFKLASIIYKGKTSIPRLPIISITLVTKFEIYNCLHKGFDPKIYTHSIFKSLLDKSQAKKLSDFVENKYLMDNIELFTVARMAQKIRNNFLQTDIFGHQYADEGDGVGVGNEFHTLPKELLRVGALLQYAIKEAHLEEPKEEARTNLEEGHNFIVDVVKRSVNLSPDIDELSGKLSARSFPLSVSPDMSADDILLIIEILFDEMLKNVSPSVRSVIDELIEAGEI